MLIMIFIIVGALFIVLGLFGLVMLAVQPLKKTWMIVFRRRMDYLLFETSEKGKRLLAAEIHTVRTTCLTFIILGAFLLGTGLYLKYAPRGTGRDEAGTHASGIDNEGTYWVDEVGYDTYIRINGTTIKFNNEEIKDIEALKEKLDQTDRSVTILLVDDYASSAAFHEVQTLLKEKGMDAVEHEE